MKLFKPLLLTLLILLVGCAQQNPFSHENEDQNLVTGKAVYTDMTLVELSEGGLYLDAYSNFLSFSPDFSGHLVSDVFSSLVDNSHFLYLISGTFLGPDWVCYVNPQGAYSHLIGQYECADISTTSDTLLLAPATYELYMISPTSQWTYDVGYGSPGASSAPLQNLIIFEDDDFIYEQSVYSTPNCVCGGADFNGMCAKNDKLVGQEGTFDLSIPTTLPAGDYELVVRYCDENDDAGAGDAYTVSQNAAPLANWNSQTGEATSTWKEETVALTYNPGDTITVGATRSIGGTFTRIDRVTLRGPAENAAMCGDETVELDEECDDSGNPDCSGQCTYNDCTLNGIRSYYNLDSYIYKAYDLSGSRDGIIVNNPSLVSGVIDSALDFDASQDQYVEMEVDLRNQQQVSYSIWFNPTEQNNNRILSTLVFNTYDSGSGTGTGADPDGYNHHRAHLQIEPDGRVESFRHSYGGGCYAERSHLFSTDTVNLYQWNHIVVTVDYDDTMRSKMYLNGVYQGEVTNPNGLSCANDEHWFWLGRRKGHDNNNFNGALDEFAVFNKVLTEEEALHLYNQGSGASACRASAFCGDGIKDLGEQCDTGGASDSDCTSTCELPAPESYPTYLVESDITAANGDILVYDYSSRTSGSISDSYNAYYNTQGSGHPPMHASVVEFFDTTSLLGDAQAYISNYQNSIVSIANQKLYKLEGTGGGHFIYFWISNNKRVEIRVEDPGNYDSAVVDYVALHPPTYPPQGAVCGDGVIDTAESCDDGNTFAWDGCSDTCQQECVLNSVSITGYSDTNGNNMLDQGESVSVSATVADDAVCNGYSNNFLLQLDASDNNGDCTIEFVGGDVNGINGYLSFNASNTASILWSTPSIPAQCQGKTISAGFAALREPTSSLGNQLSNIVVATGSFTFYAPACGDGQLDSGEQCDDGNSNDGDGCSSTCQIEATCSDGILNGDEEGVDCGGSQCSACQTGPVCGNGICEQGETSQSCSQDCQSQNNDNFADATELFDTGSGFIASNDLAGSTMQSGEFGYSWWDQSLWYKITPSVSGQYVLSGVKHQTGGGKIQATVFTSFSSSAIIDNGWIDIYHSASKTISLNAGTTYYIQVAKADSAPGQFSVAVNRVGTVVCGDGQVGGIEQCDDGNTLSGDGCSNTCAHECAINHVALARSGTPFGGIAINLSVSGGGSSCSQVTNLVILANSTDNGCSIGPRSADMDGIYPALTIPDDTAPSTSISLQWNLPYNSIDQMPQQCRNTVIYPKLAKLVSNVEQDYGVGQVVTDPSKLIGSLYWP